MVKWRRVKNFGLSDLGLSGLGLSGFGLSDFYLTISGKQHITNTGQWKILLKGCGGISIRKVEVEIKPRSFGGG